MLVKIVEKKDTVTEMTIDELAEKVFIGLVIKKGVKIFGSAGIGDKWYIYRNGLDGYFMPIMLPCYQYNIHTTELVKLLEIIKADGNIEFHTFENAKELYKWLAE
ncbi:MAG: hypothetical protein WC389_08070 [Lutibacter sp.]|jgi:hypothetical protein